MAKRKKPSPTFRRLIISLAIFFFLLVAIVITTTAVQQRQDLFSFAAGVIRRCRRIPAGNYDVKVETYTPIKWEVDCPFPDGDRSGEIPATTIPFGYRWVPTIRVGNKYTLETTLEDICTSPRSLEAAWSNVCQVCQYIDCSEVKVKGNLAINRINCQLGAYQAYGWGNLDLTYQGEGLGVCTAKATYRGRLMGVFVVGTQD